MTQAARWPLSVSDIETSSGHPSWCLCGLETRAAGFLPGGQRHFLKPLERKYPLPLSNLKSPLLATVSCLRWPCPSTVRVRAGFLISKMLSRDLGLKVHMLLPVPRTQLTVGRGVGQAPC